MDIFSEDIPRSTVSNWVFELKDEGKIDVLRGLKENVIIGKLIPAGTGFRKEKKEK